MSAGIKFTTCRDCNMEDLHWTQENGRWVLNEPHGLPHACEVRMARVKAEREQRSQQLKDMYAKEKERITAIPDTQMSPQMKNQHLYRYRKQLWPNMFRRRT